MDDSSNRLYGELVMICDSSDRFDFNSLTITGTFRMSLNETDELVDDVGFGVNITCVGSQLGKGGIEQVFINVIVVPVSTNSVSLIDKSLFDRYQLQKEIPLDLLGTQKQVEYCS